MIEAPQTLAPIAWGQFVAMMIVSIVLINGVIIFRQLFIHNQTELDKKFFLILDIWLIATFFAVLGISRLPMDKEILGCLNLLYFMVSVVVAFIIYHRTY